MTKEQRQEYIDFMYNKENICKCSLCPENQNKKVIFDGGQHDILPCGQQNCWVEIHCK